MPWAEWGCACTIHVQLYYLSFSSARRCYLGLTGCIGLKMLSLSTDLDLYLSHKAEVEAGVYLLLLHSDSLVSTPVQQQGQQGYAPFWCLWTPEGPSQRPQVAIPAERILGVTRERQGSCLCSHKCLSISHLVFNRPCAGVKPPPSLSPGHRLMLSLP